MSQLRAGAGASDSLFQHERPNKPDSSRFDITRFTNFTSDAGMILPFDVFPVYPGDDLDINFEMVLNTLPLVQPTMTQYKVVTHWYYMEAKDCWKGFQTFITKGRSGNINKRIPKIDLNFGYYGDAGAGYICQDIDTEEFSFNESSTPPTSRQLTGKLLAKGKHSLASFIGVPSDSSFLGHAVSGSNDFLVDKKYLPFTFVASDKGSGINSTLYKNYQDAISTGFNQYRYVNALPFMMYQSIVKHNYVNQNMLQDCTALFPEQGDNDWLLPYNASTVNAISDTDIDSNDKICKYYETVSGKITDNASHTGVFTKDDKLVRLDSLRYAEFDDDYFTTALPWLQRGDASSLKDIDFSLYGTDLADALSIVSDPLGVDYSKIPVYAAYGSDGETYIQPRFSFRWDSDDEYFAESFGDSADFDGTTSDHVNVPLFALQFYHDIAQNLALSSPDNPNVRGSLELSVNKLRALIALQVWQERNARVNGDYNAMIFQHWLVNPHASDHKPVYIGGTADYVSFSTILQNSQTSSDSPLGSTAGRGSVAGNGSVGKFHCSDYGFVMAIMIIKPVTTYQQGVEHFLSCENVFEDFIQPEFQGLEPEPILNKELFVSGVDSDDDDLFGYQERYTYAKVRYNVNRGLFQSAPDKDSLYGSMTQARWFASKPELSYQFLCMSPDNMRRDWLAYPAEPAFYLQTASKVYVNRKLAYMSQPETFGF